MRTAITRRLLHNMIEKIKKTAEESEPKKTERIRDLEQELMELRGQREEELKRRKELAKKVIEEVKEKIEIISWNISGSTTREDFAFSSDLDIDILLRKELTTQDHLYLNDYLVKRTLGEDDIYIQFHDFTLEQIKEMRDYDVKMYEWYKKYFKLES